MSRLTLKSIGLFFALTGMTDLPLLAQVEPGWIGKRVVQRKSDFTLLVNGEAVEPNGKAIDFYRVEQVDDRSLLLKAETLGSGGWATTDEVVPVEHAVDFFTEQIRAHPGDPFFHAARALIWHDKKVPESALSDYDAAIRLDPKNASHYRGRGLVWQSTNQYDRAIADFDEAIRLDPRYALAFIARAAIRSNKKEYASAIADDSEAIWLDPRAIAAYDNRGLAWYARNEFAKAIVDYNLAIRLDSLHAPAYCNRGDAWVALRRFDKALADFNQAIQIDEKCARAYGSRAWIWCTCPDARYRDGKKAIESATSACELTAWKDARLLAVLAAAYAETGDFEAATTWQTRANALGAEGENKTTGQTRLKSYQEKKPVRDPGV